MVLLMHLHFFDDIAIAINFHRKNFMLNISITFQLKLLELRNYSLLSGIRVFLK